MATSSRRRDDVPPETHYEARGRDNEAIVRNREPFQNVEKFTDEYGNEIHEGCFRLFRRVPDSYRVSDCYCRILSIYWDPMGLPGGRHLSGTNNEGFELYECRLTIVVKIWSAPPAYDHLEGRQYKGRADALNYYLYGRSD